MFVSMRRSLVNDEYDDPWHDRYFPAWSLWLGGGLLSINWLWRIWAVLLCLATLTSWGLFINVVNFQPSAPAFEWAFFLAVLLIMMINGVLAVGVTAHAAKGSIPLVAAAAGFLFLAAAGLVVIYLQTLGALTLFLPLLPSYRVAALFVYDCTFLRKEVSEMKGSMLTQEQKANSYRVLITRVSQLQQTHKWWLICSSAYCVSMLLFLVYSVIMLFSKGTITPSSAMDFSAFSVMFFAPVVPPLAELVTMGYTNRAIETIEREFFKQDRVTMFHLQIMREPARLSFLGIPITVNKAMSIAVSFAATAAFQAIRSALSL